MSSINKYTKEVENSLTRLAINVDKERAAKTKKYLGTNLQVYGLDTKTQVEACKKGYSFFNEDKENIFSEFNTIYLQSKSHEGKNQALIYLDKHYKHIPVKLQLEYIPNWVCHVDNWAHSDYVSKFLTRLTEHKDTQKQMLSLIKKWNTSKLLWERRQSLISLYYYARTKKEHIDFDLSKKLISNLITDKEYFVQKAVGWSLRESYNVYPKQTFEFIEENIKHISSTAFTTCLEKMSDKQKLALKQQRK